MKGILIIVRDRESGNLEDLIEFENAYTKKGYLRKTPQFFIDMYLDKGFLVEIDRPSRLKLVK